MGNSIKVANAHYLQIRDANFDKAIGKDIMEGVGEVRRIPRSD